jgi:acyl transferase domain-containing protein
MPQMFHHGDQLTGHVDTNGIRGAHDTNDIPATDGASGARAVNYVGDNASQNTNLSLLVFSANHEESLAATIRNMKEFYAQTRPSLQDLAHTLGSRREHLPYRTFAITDPSRPFDVNTANMKAATIGLKPVFIFTGQGAQWPGMGKELMVAYPSFLRDIRAMDSHLAGLKQPPSFSMEGNLFCSQDLLC